MPKYMMIRSEPQNFSGQDTQNVDVECPTGMKPVGGGFRVSGAFPKVMGSHPLIQELDSKDGWRLIVQGADLNQYTVYVYVICVSLDDYGYDV